MTQNIIRCPESRQREPNQTNETQIFSMSFIYSGKWSNIAYLWVAKVCESLGLAVNLKVKLESICAEVFSVSAMTIKCQYVTCFIQRTGIYQSLIMFVEVNHVTNKGDYWGPWKKELLLLIRLENVTKPSLKSSDSTNSQSDRLCTNGGNSRPLLPSREVVDQQRSLQSRTCNSLWGCKSSQSNF